MYWLNAVNCRGNQQQGRLVDFVVIVETVLDPKMQKQLPINSKVVIR
jgi:hypothetical protein